MVHGALGYCGPGGNLAIWINLHRDVLHIYLLLGLQNLLCVWLHAAGYALLPLRIVYKSCISVFLILLTVTVCVTIVCTYFLLNAEDYR